MTEQRIVKATRTINAPAATIFELIADPARQPEWDGNDNLAQAPAGQRITAVDQQFTMALTNDESRTNHVIEFDEGRRIAWKPAPTGQEPRGHIFRWELRPIDDNSTEVTHTYDWTQLTDETRFARARSYTEDALMNSVNRLSLKAENQRYTTD